MCSNNSNHKGGKGEMTKTPISVQDLRRRIYVKAKAEPTWRFWGLYVHICKMETLQEAYRMAKRNNGAPGIDGVTFEAIEESGVEGFLKQIQDELDQDRINPDAGAEKGDSEGRGLKGSRAFDPRNPRPRGSGCNKTHPGADLRTDFQSGSYGYRPKRSAHDAVSRVDQAIVQGLTRIIDLDLRASFDNVQHSLLLEVARRVQDASMMKLLKMILQLRPEGREFLRAV